MESTHRKPTAICSSKHEPVAVLPDGFHARVAMEIDITAIMAFQARCWPFALTELETAGQLWRLCTYGLVLLVEQEGSLVAVNINEYLANGVQYGVRNTVAPEARGHGLGVYMPQLVALEGQKHGLRMRHAIVSPTNPVGATNLLNRVGFVATGFRTSLPGEARPEFLVELPLTAAGITGQRVDVALAQEWVDGSIRGKEYELIGRLDTGGLESLYRDTPFRVVAALPDHWLAVPLA